ncbi:hypothetical protein BH20ACI4_BH20ACI4_01400 [soil metagenome]
MFYKPTYCSHCGEKIETTETLPWKKSGRFCDVCKSEFSFQEWLPKVFILLSALFGLIGIGGYLKSGETTNVAALKQNKSLETVAKIESKDHQANDSNRQSLSKNEQKTESNLTANTNKTVVASPKLEFETVKNEKVYFCGAATKKGTPCSRKVKGGGRCWQHKGQEALLAQEKLLITQ